VFSGAEKISKKNKTKSSEYFENIFEILKFKQNKNRKKEQ
jgi:hypothetical protein